MLAGIDNVGMLRGMPSGRGSHDHASPKSFDRKIRVVRFEWNHYSVYLGKGIRQK
jgi:hypothetical protein